MNLASAVAIVAGGPGSGRKPEFGSPQSKKAAWLDKRQTSIFGPKHAEEIQKNAKLKKDLDAFGTATGVTKAWDTRGRGRTGELDSLRDLHDGIKQMLLSGNHEEMFQAQRSKMAALVDGARKVASDAPMIKMASQQMARANSFARQGDHKMALAYQDSALTAVHHWLNGRQGTLNASSGWIGFDFDGTLADAVIPFDPAKTGRPIKKMLDLLKAYLKQGTEVRIFSARVGNDPVGRDAIDKWCLKYVGRKLPITDKKDHLMMKLYDDKAVNPKDLSAGGPGSGRHKEVWDMTRSEFAGTKAFGHPMGTKGGQSIAETFQKVGDATQGRDNAIRNALAKFPDGTEIKGWKKITTGGDVFWQKGSRVVFNLHKEIGTDAAHQAVLKVKDLKAYGTSEGVTKSWDIRGRSRARVGELLKQGGWKTKYASTEWAQFHRPGQPGVLIVNRYFDRWQHKDDAGKRLASGDSLASLADYMEKLHGKQMQASGTSEGAKKAWDTRGRGKNTMPEREQKVRAKKTVLLPSGAMVYVGRPHAPQDRPLTPPKQGVYPVGKHGGYGGVKVSKGRLWPEQAYWRNGVPDAGLHPLKDKFTEANRQLNPKDYTIEKRNAYLSDQSTQVYAALDHAGDRGATVFVEPGRVVEFNHDSAGRLQYGRKLLPSLGDTQVVRFNSGRAQSTFLRQRYGIEKKEE